jgi:hypothetical protein
VSSTSRTAAHQHQTTLVRARQWLLFCKECSQKENHLGMCSSHISTETRAARGRSWRLPRFNPHHFLTMTVVFSMRARLASIVLLHGVHLISRPLFRRESIPAELTSIFKLIRLAWGVWMKLPLKQRKIHTNRQPHGKSSTR